MSLEQHANVSKNSHLSCKCPWKDTWKPCNCQQNCHLSCKWHSKALQLSTKSACYIFSKLDGGLLGAFGTSELQSFEAATGQSPGPCHDQPPFRPTTWPSHPSGRLPGPCSCHPLKDKTRTRYFWKTNRKGSLHVRQHEAATSHPKTKHVQDTFDKPTEKDHFTSDHMMNCSIKLSMYIDRPTLVYIYNFRNTYKHIGVHMNPKA